MNGPEKKVFILAVLLLGLGVLVKLSPWDPLPRIETFSYEEESREVFREQNALTWHASKISDSTATESAEAPEKKKPKKAKKAKPAVHFPLAINRATVDELCAIKGVGPKLAEKIIAYRDAHGGFQGLGDLKKVSGIGKKKAENILSFVIFD